MKTLTKTVARRLREARNIGGFSQREAARRMGMHRPTISEIEAGRRKVSADELQHFAKVYEVSVEWLLGQQTDTRAARASRVERAYRELQKLDPDDVERLLMVIAIQGRGKPVGRRSRGSGGKPATDRGSPADSPHIQWTPRDNARRCELIDRDIQGSLTFDEAEELEELQRAMRKFLDAVAPLPMEGARRLHAALLRKHRSRRSRRKLASSPDGLSE